MENNSNKFIWSQVYPKDFYGQLVTLEHFTATTVGGKVYVFGGISDKDVSNRIFILDVKEQEWSKCTTRGRLPRSRCMHSATLVNDLLYILFGRDETDWEGFTDAFTFDITKQSWSQIELQGQDPGPTYGHSADYFQVNHEIVLFKGRSRNRYYNDVYLLNLERNVWLQAFPKGRGPSARYKHGSCIVNSTLYIYGGRTKRALGGLFCLNLESTHLKWSMVEEFGSVPRPKYYSSLTSAQGRLYLFGGAEIIDTNELFLYDLQTRTWTKLKQVLPQDRYLQSNLVIGHASPRSRHCAVFLRGKLVVLGGKGRSVTFKNYEELSQFKR